MTTQLTRATCALALGLWGCSGSGAETDASGDRAHIDVLTWWSQPSELDAIEAVIAVHLAKFPQVEVRVLSSQNQGTLATDVEKGLAEGAPPTAFQANLGGNALQWAESSPDLSERARAWSSEFRETILERLSKDGKLIGVPLALTRQNNAYYNLEVL
jgi:ABC-type glycerol-3-phosphate transport system substrate-binding protein